MKNILTLFFAFVFSSGLAFAQNNDASLSQNGNDNDAVIEQFGSLNSASIEQGFNGQGQNGAEASIRQDGAENDAFIKQRAWANRGNDHSVEQVGDENRAFVDAFNGDNEGIVVQIGDKNYALMQHGSAREGFVSLLQYGYENNARARQFNGNGNSASVEQHGDDNRADVLQTGNSNRVLIEQGVFGSSYGSIAEFTQTGDGNYFETKQVRSIDNSVIGTQEGDNNYYRVGLRGSDNVVTMDMKGDANRGSWTIGSLGWPHQPVDNQLSINIVGDGNISTGVIRGDDNVVVIQQFGDGNRIGTLWYTTDGVSIAGNDNVVTIDQFSDFNSATVSVTGNGNSATVYQN